MKIQPYQILTHGIKQLKPKHHEKNTKNIILLCYAIAYSSLFYTIIKYLLLTN